MEKSPLSVVERHGVIEARRSLKGGMCEGNRSDFYGALLVPQTEPAGPYFGADRRGTYKAGSRGPGRRESTKAVIKQPISMPLTVTLLQRNIPHRASADRGSATPARPGGVLPNPTKSFRGTPRGRIARHMATTDGIHSQGVPTLAAPCWPADSLHRSYRRRVGSHRDRPKSLQAAFQPMQTIAGKIS